MSNSAFTPTQIEVTNEVPVNVPVVTSQEQFYTPTITAVSGTNPTLGTVTTNTASYRQVGDHLQVTYNLVQTSAGSTGSNTYKISLPPGLTIDTTKLPTNSPVVGNATIFNGVDRALFAVLVRDSTGVFLTGLYDAGEGDWGNVFYPLNNSSLFVRVTFSVPIAEWAGSGTTTLATRAVEEYAWNSSTTDADDTTSFGYGPNGVNFGSFTTARNKRVRFQTPIQSTDILSLEFKRDGQWIPIESCTSQGCSPLFFQGTTSYGMSIEQIPGNNTDVTIKFGTYRNTSNTTYAGVGNAWSFLAGGNAQWRVRKVSGGAQVGYPVSARNIIGDTSGSVVPTGMIGEVKTFTNVTITSTTGSWTSNSTAITTLTPGNWILYGHIYIPVTSSLTGAVGFFSTNSSNDASGQVIEATRISIGSGIETTVPMVILPYSVSSNTSIYVKTRTSGASASVTFKGYAVRIS